MKTNQNPSHVLAVLLLATVFPLPAQAADRIERGEMAGYLLVPNEKVPDTFNAGYSMYVGAWPLVKTYPGSRLPKGDSAVVHRITSYNKHALWDEVKIWFEGGATASGAIHSEGAVVHEFTERGGATWKIYPDSAAKERQMPLAWTSFATPMAADKNTFGYRWNTNLVQQTETRDGALMTLPEYFHLVTKNNKQEWIPVRAEEVPAETGLANVHFERPAGKPCEPYITPDDAASSWKKPGPAAGPFQAQLGDGSVVTNYWYRFADQPALLNTDLTAQEREAMHARVEKLHRNWTRDRDYLAPPKIGKLAELDPAVIVTPPKGLEARYVPIVTRHAAKN